MAVESLHTRAARVLGWSERDVTSVSFHSLRELVRPIDPALAEDITRAIQSGSYIVGPARTALVLLACAALTGCAPEWACDGTEDYCVDGVPFDLQGLPAQYYGSALVHARLGAQLGTALNHWGVKRSALDGWRVVIQPDLLDCADAQAKGCWAPDERTITLTFFGRDTGCVEATVLAHEIGHFFEQGHANPQWCAWAPVASEFTAVPECSSFPDPTIFLSPARCSE